MFLKDFIITFEWGFFFFFFFFFFLIKFPKMCKLFSKPPKYSQVDFLKKKKKKKKKKKPNILAL